MRLCGVCLVGFTSTTLLDVMARVIGHPLLWPQEVTSAFFVYGVFVGASVATRRGDHLQLSAMTEAMGTRARRFFEVFNRAVVMAVGLFIVVFGWQNFLLMRLCGVCLVGFTSTTLLDVMARYGHPLLWPQEVTSAFFVYGVFVGASVATRRGDHLQLSALTEAMGTRARRFFEVFNRAVVMAVGLFIVVYGWQNFLTGFGSFRMPSMLPIAYLYAPIPLCGALVALFSLEQIVNGLRHGFPAAPAPSKGLT